MSGAGDGVSALPEIIFKGESLSALLDGSAKEQIEQVLVGLLPGQRWFGAKDSTIGGVTLLPLGDLEPGAHALAFADVDLGHETQRYLLPLSAVWSDEAGARVSKATPALAHLSSGERAGVLIDGAADRAFAATLFDALRSGVHLSTGSGAVMFVPGSGLARLETVGDPRPLGAEQSNLSIAYGSEIILKLYRRLRAGEQPDVEVAQFLSEVGRFASTPEFLGEIRYEEAGAEPTSLAAAFAFVANQGDAWAHVTKGLARNLERDGPFDETVSVGHLLGRRTAEMHKALAVETDNPAFAVEPLTPADLATWAREVEEEAGILLGRLRDGRGRLSSEAQTLADEVLGGRDGLMARIRTIAGMSPSGGRSRIHGDYHLGQVLAADGDFIIIDFEGEPKRSLAERREKSSPLRDVAGMLRSFHYAAFASGRVSAEARDRLEAWRNETSADFLSAYRAHVAGALSYPGEAGFADALIDLFLLQKAVYEVGYELANRPDWVHIPLSGMQDLLKSNERR